MEGRRTKVDPPETVQLSPAHPINPDDGDPFLVIPTFHPHHKMTGVGGRAQKGGGHTNEQWRKRKKEMLCDESASGRVV